MNPNQDHVIRPESVLILELKLYVRDAFSTYTDYQVA